MSVSLASSRCLVLQSCRATGLFVTKLKEERALPCAFMENPGLPGLHEQTDTQHEVCEPQEAGAREDRVTLPACPPTAQAPCGFELPIKACWLFNNATLTYLCAHSADSPGTLDRALPSAPPTCLTSSLLVFRQGCVCSRWRI